MIRGAALFVLIALVLLAAHSPYLALPYFWDEMGQFVPAALDIYHDAAWVPHSTVPNSHPPGVMASLALVWKVFGYSIPATRAAMLLLASIAAFVTWRLARVLLPAWTLVPVILLLLDPLFYTQSMMAQLDMPAMVFTLIALLLFFEDRHVLAAAACVALVLTKETGALLPLILGGALWFDRRRRKEAFYYVVPFPILAVWFFVLWRTTGHLFGDAGFTHYNIGYALNPVRASLSLLRRFYYLCLADCRWIGFLAIALAWRRTKLFSTRAWKITWLFIGAHTILVSVLGGAELERYLLPVIPLVYSAMVAAWSTVPLFARILGFAALAASLVLSLFTNPPFPFPYENNLAMADFVVLHHDAAQYLERNYPTETVYTAWPLTQALRNPVFGYVDKKLAVAETVDLRSSTLHALNPQNVRVLVLYSRTWEPEWGVLRYPAVEQFLKRYYEYDRQMNSDEVLRRFGLVPVRRWERRGQWVEIYSR
ncbi:MAG TPA: glycosyltransferase family 39 protein [Bryobacteraceae bacterium]|nr:glycosyltransferase family 39 protein [Bryobacteraceae bacterium]